MQNTINSTRLTLQQATILNKGGVNQTHNVVTDIGIVIKMYISVQIN